MSPEQAVKGVLWLQVKYPTMTKMDEASITAYAQEIGSLRWDDFVEGATEVVRTVKFFPAISELLEAAENAHRRRLEKQEHDEREERLAIQAGEDRIMDPKSGVHRVAVGPNHQIFLDYLNGTRTFPEPEWMRRKREMA